MDYNLALNTVFNNSYLPATHFSVDYGMMYVLRAALIA